MFFTMDVTNSYFKKGTLKTLQHVTELILSKNQPKHIKVKELVNENSHQDTYYRKYLKELEDQGILESGRQGKSRYYQFTDEGSKITSFLNEISELKKQ